MGPASKQCTQGAAGTSYDHNTIVCSAPANVGVGHNVSIVVSGQKTFGVQPKYNYDKPVINSIDPIPGPTLGNVVRCDLLALCPFNA